MALKAMTPAKENSARKKRLAPTCPLSGMAPSHKRNPIRRPVLLPQTRIFTRA
jgi:hypothetical protein